MRLRGAAWAATVTGAVFILGISSYWNATAIGGKAAQTAALQSTVTRAEEAVAGALHTYTGYRSLVPALQSLSAEVGGLASCEGSDGCITGTPGKSGVYQTLVQLKSKSDGLIAAISDADKKLVTRARESDACLAGLRSALTKDDAQALSASADCVNGVIADIAANRLNAPHCRCDVCIYRGGCYPRVHQERQAEAGGREHPQRPARTRGRYSCLRSAGAKPGSPCAGDNLTHEPDEGGHCSLGCDSAILDDRNRPRPVSGRAALFQRNHVGVPAPAPGC